MPKPAMAVQYNDEGEWSYALVMDHLPGGNLRLLVKSEKGGGWEIHESPQGTEPGEWRQPK